MAISAGFLGQVGVVLRRARGDARWDTATRYPGGQAAWYEFPYVDSSSFNTKLVFDNAVTQCAVWEFSVPVDSTTSLTNPLLSLWYTMSTGITGGISIDVSLFRVIANGSDSH